MKKSPDELHKIWSEYRRCKPILKLIKEITKKDGEQEILLQGLERLITKISVLNVENMTQYNTNMTTIVQSSRIPSQFWKQGQKMAQVVSRWCLVPRQPNLLSWQRSHLGPKT